MRDAIESIVDGVASGIAECSKGAELVCAALPIPASLLERIDAFRALAGEVGDAFVYEHPESRTTIASRGCQRALEASGRERFDEIDARARALFEGLVVARNGNPASTGPVLVGGFSFRPEGPEDETWLGFPAARFVLPECQLVRRSDEAWLYAVAEKGEAPRIAAQRAGHFLETLLRGDAESAPPVAAGFELRGSAGLAPGPSYRVRADRSHADFCAQAQAARRAIALGELSKVVLARALDVESEAAMEVVPFLQKLRDSHPNCVTFAIRRDEACFLGATPEQLLAVTGNHVRTAAVAGSAPRGRGPAEDDRMGRALRESKKEQEEHAFVVDALRHALESSCTSLSMPEAPELLRLAGIQHLVTPIEGRLSTRTSLLKLAGRLHPSPAVGGVPTGPGLAWIDQCEGLDRGWYAGPIGFLDAAGDGELRVALRSALLRGDRARLFAGAGLVAQSDPLAELEETRVKLRTLLAPLTEI